MKEIFERNLQDAKNKIKKLNEPGNFGKFEENLERLMFFYVANYVGKDDFKCNHEFARIDTKNK